MLFSVALTTLLSLATVVVAIPADVGRLHGLESRSTGRKCGTHPTPEHVSKNEKSFASLRANNRISVSVDVTLGTVNVPVYFHVISNADGTGDIP